MKVLFIIQRLQLRGAEIFACQLAEELIQRGITVDIVYLFNNRQSLKEQFPNLNFTALDGDESKRFRDFSAYKKLSVIVKNNQYDIVQANAGDTLKYAALSKFIFGWRSTLVFRNASKMSAFMKGRLHKILNSFFLDKCDYFISVSENCRQDLISIYPNAQNKSKTVTIGTYQFDSVIPIKTDTHEPIFVNIGSLVVEKNHIFLIDVFKEYFDKFGKGYLWIVGDGVLRNILENKIKTYGLEERVKLWGYRKDALAILKAGSVLVMPSKIEGLPGVILEALSCRVPIVASNVGGIPEVVHHGINGFCLEGQDIKSYVECMERLTTDNTLISKFKTEGYNIVQQEYLLPQIASSFINVYDRWKMNP